ncbi:MAG: alpha/beta fold hydrolase [Planctomycetota bacterium]
MNPFFEFAQIMFVGFVLALLLVTASTARRLRRPPRKTYGSAVARNLPGDPSELDSPRDFEPSRATIDGFDLALWDLPGDNPDGPVAILWPGWGDSRIGALARLEPFLSRTSRLVLVDPPGHGESSGLCFMGTREPRVLDALIREATSDTERGRGVILYGWSMGAGVAIACAAQDEENTLNIRCVIGEAPYRLAPTPAKNVMRQARMPWTLNGPLAFWFMGLRLGVGPTWRGFDRAEHASHLCVPLLIVHGESDAVCPLDDGRAIAARAPDGRLEAIPGGGHNDLWRESAHRARTIESIGAFLDTHVR